MIVLIRLPHPANILFVQFNKIFYPGVDCTRTFYAWLRDNSRVDTRKAWFSLAPQAQAQAQAQA